MMREAFVSDLNEFFGHPAGMAFITLAVLAVLVLFIMWLRGRGSSDVERLIKESEAQGGDGKDTPLADDDQELPPDEGAPAEPEKKKH